MSELPKGPTFSNNLRTNVLATEVLAERLITSCGWVKGHERNVAIERLAAEFQKAWHEEWKRLSDERST